MGYANEIRKRSRSGSPSLWQGQAKSPRYEGRPRRDDFRSKQNQAGVDQQERDWVAKEDEFVLKQAKKKAQIRLREGRAKPIDWLAVVLAEIDPEKDILEDDGSKDEVEIADPTALIEGLNLKELRDLDTEINHYLALEKRRENRKFWKAMKLLCKDCQDRQGPSAPGSRGVGSVSADVARLLGPKNRQQLDILEDQVCRKLKSDEDIDVEYWEHLLGSINLYKAKADLKAIYKSVFDTRLQLFRKDQVKEAEVAKTLFRDKLLTSGPIPDPSQSLEAVDPEPMLKIEPVDKGLKVIAEDDFLAAVVADRKRAQNLGYVPRKPSKPSDTTTIHGPALRPTTGEGPRMNNALYDREVARGVEEDEEVFAAEEEVPTAGKKKWDGNYRPRKPRYFNRVQMGYDWNKYNQTHYDQDNPPPKVVQGYKFNIFYPDLIDKTKAPSFRIERENGRKRGQSFAAAGEEDTCIIRFVSGPPYEDLAFRIVDKEWDYSAKRERGFKSSFDKGILQLHFQFKKVYYRK